MSPIEKVVADVPVHPVPPPEQPDSTIPYVTHKGSLNMGGITLDVVVLNTGERLVTGEFITQMLEGLQQ